MDATDFAARLLGGYAHPELEAAFRLVEPLSHWKDRIDATVDLRNPDTDIPRLAFAVEFFTATRATITLVSGTRYRVTADGYRAGPAGDH